VAIAARGGHPVGSELKAGKSPNFTNMITTVNHFQRKKEKTRIEISEISGSHSVAAEDARRLGSDDVSFC